MDELIRLWQAGPGGHPRRPTAERLRDQVGTHLSCQEIKRVSERVIISVISCSDIRDYQLEALLRDGICSVLDRDREAWIKWTN